MNLNEYPRVTILPLPNPDDRDQYGVNRKFIDCLVMLSRRDDDKEVRLRAIDTSRGVSRYTIDQLLAPITALSHIRQHSIINPLDHTSAANPGTVLFADANGLPVGVGARAGISVLVAGVVAVASALVTANSMIFLTVQQLGTVVQPVAIAVTARVPGVSFTITSADNTDTSTVSWMIVEP